MFRRARKMTASKRSIPKNLVLACIVIAAASAQPSAASITEHELPFLGPYVIDSSGNAYLYSSNTSGATPGAAQMQNGGGICYINTPIVGETPSACPDAFIVKIDPSGNTVFATLLGGPTTDYATGLAIDTSGNLYITGNTGGSFPTTSNAAIPSSTTSTSFAAKLSPDGSKFLYVTYLPAQVASASAIAVDSQGNAYVAGNTGDHHVCVVKIRADGSSIVYTTLLEGSNTDAASAIAVDAQGNAFVAGFTQSPDFPVTAGVVQNALAGTQNAFVTGLNPNGAIVFSTFLGGSASDSATALQIDSNDNLYLAGNAGSLDFPTTAGSFEPAVLVPLWSTAPGGFVAELAAGAASIVYSTYLPIEQSLYLPVGESSLLATGPSGDTYIAGVTGALFPITKSAPQPCYGGNTDTILVHLDAHGALLDATYYGGYQEAMQGISANGNPLGLAVGADGSILLAGAYGASWTLADITFGAPGSSPAACMSPGILNSATLGWSNFPGTIAPGEFITITGFGIGPDTGVASQPDAQGNLPTSLAGVQVLINNQPAPILYAQSQQVNVLAPFELSGMLAATLRLNYNNTTFDFPGTVPVEFASPGFFRLEPNVSSQAYAVNQDGTINGPSNPAPRGSVVALWGTGFGWSGYCSTGGLNPYAPTSLASGFSVAINSGPGFVGVVTYAGGAPTFPCGVYQVNVQIPTNVPPGEFTVSPVVLEELGNGGTTNIGSSVGSTIWIK